jgi:hypothetical protein
LENAFHGAEDVIEIGLFDHRLRHPSQIHIYPTIHSAYYERASRTWQWTALSIGEAPVREGQNPEIALTEVLLAF